MENITFLFKENHTQVYLTKVKDDNSIERTSYIKGEDLSKESPSVVLKIEEGFNKENK